MVTNRAFETSCSGASNSIEDRHAAYGDHLGRYVSLLRKLSVRDGRCIVFEDAHEESMGSICAAAIVGNVSTDDARAPHIGVHETPRRARRLAPMNVFE